MQRLQERLARDHFRYDATSWMDLVPQLDTRTSAPASGCPMVIMVQPAHDRKSNPLLDCVLNGKARIGSVQGDIAQALGAVVPG